MHVFPGVAVPCDDAGAPKKEKASKEISFPSFPVHSDSTFTVPLAPHMHITLLNTITQDLGTLQIHTVLFSTARGQFSESLSQSNYHWVYLTSHLCTLSTGYRFPDAFEFSSA